MRFRHGTAAFNSIICNNRAASKGHPETQQILSSRVGVFDDLDFVPTNRVFHCFGPFGSLSCPACGGVLSQIKHGSPLRFRCQVEHAFTAEVLAADQEGSLDEAVRMALRIVEEFYSCYGTSERTVKQRAHAETLRVIQLSASFGDLYREISAASVRPTDCGSPHKSQ
jgi:hypothetical protein